MCWGYHVLLECFSMKRQPGQEAILDELFYLQYSKAEHIVIGVYKALDAGPVTTDGGRR